MNIFIATFLLQDDLKSTLTQNTDFNKTKVLQNSLRGKKVNSQLKTGTALFLTKVLPKDCNSSLMQWVKEALEDLE